MADEEGAGGKKSRLHITHAQNDARYVEQGMLLFLAPDPDSAKDLARMNKKKNGRPFEYSELTIMAIAGVRYNLQLAYRSCEGLAISALGKKDAPDYTTLCRRINKMNVTSAEGCVEVRSKGSLMRLIPDGTGLTPSTRSDWIRHKHKVKRGWIRLSVMIEHDTQKIVAFKVTDERTGDSPQFEGLLEDSLECLGIDADRLLGNARQERSDDKKDQAQSRPADKKDQGDRQSPRESDVIEQAINPASTDEGLEESIIAVLGDGGYDTREIHSLCKKLGLYSLIKVRLNSNSRSKGKGRARSLAVQDQLCGSKRGPKELAALDAGERSKNQKEWKRKVGYGRRWPVEIVFSAFKRRFGDFVMARTMRNIINEIGIKVRIYNELLDVAREAIMRA